MGGVCSDLEPDFVGADGKLSRMDLLRQTERNIRTLATMDAEGGGDGPILAGEGNDGRSAPSSARARDPGSGPEWYGEILETITAAAPGLMSSQTGAPANAKDFLNGILAVFWPHMSKFMRDTMVHELNPKLEQKLGSGAYMDPEACTFGDVPPYFRDVRLVSQQPGAAGGMLTNLVFRCDVQWEATDSHFDLNLKGFKLGIERIKFKGVLYFEAVQMLEIKPLFEGARVYFLDPPEIAFDFEGKISLLSEIPMLRQTILRVITSKVADMAVAPHMQGGVLSKEFDIFRIKHPRPRGLLQLTVWCCKGLPAVDRTITSWGKPTCGHPYVEVCCGGQAYKSEVLSNTSNPEFGPKGTGFRVHLVIFRATQQTILVNVHDEHLLRQASLLGSVRLPATSLIGRSGDYAKAEDDGAKITLELEDEDLVKGRRGSVVVSAAWRPLVDNPDQTHEEGMFWVSMGVYHASHLPMEDAKTMYWVEMEMSCTHVDWHAEVQDTPRKKLIIVEDKHDAIKRNEELDKKIELCRKHGVSEEDMAKVLSVDPAVIHERASMQEAGVAGSAPVGAQTHPGDKRVIQWDHAADFLIADAEKATCTFVLFAKSPGDKAPRELGRQVYTVPEVVAADQADNDMQASTPVPPSKEPGAPPVKEDPKKEAMRAAALAQMKDETAGRTMIKNVALSGSNITMKVRIQLRNIGRPSSRLGAPG